MFINFSNHPHEQWGETQIKEASQYGEIVDVPFPSVAAHISENEVEHIANQYVDKIKRLTDCGGTIMVQGEFTLTYSVVKKLKEAGYKVVSACSERNVIDEIDDSGNHIKRSHFEFKRFREYQ